MISVEFKHKKILRYEYITYHKVNKIILTNNLIVFYLSTNKETFKLSEIESLNIYDTEIGVKNG